MVLMSELYESSKKTRKNDIRLSRIIDLMISGFKDIELNEKK